MIKIVAKNTVKKENKADFINTAKELIEKSRAEEGCISYTLNESLDGKYLTFIEEWKDEKSIESNKWMFYAILSAVFASLTSILGKIGISGIESNLGTAIRTIVVLIMAWIVVFVTK